MTEREQAGPQEPDFENPFVGLAYERMLSLMLLEYGMCTPRHVKQLELMVSVVLGGQLAKDITGRALVDVVDTQMPQTGLPG